MVSDMVAYGLLASIFVVNTLRMVVGKPGRLAHRPVRLFDRLRRMRKKISPSIDS